MTDSPNRVVERMSVFFCDRVHGYLHRNRNELLHLFRTASRPLGNDGHFRIRHIGKCIYRCMLERNHTGNDGNRRTKKMKNLFFNENATILSINLCIVFFRF